MPAGAVAFWSLSLMLAITPGADWAYAISAGLRYRTVTPAVGGLLLGHLAATVVVAAGVAALLARSPLIMTGLTLARLPDLAGRQHAGPAVDPAGRRRTDPTSRGCGRPSRGSASAG